MRVLYLSCHAIQEYDELKLFRELGVDVFAHGAYMRPNQPSELRPAVCDDCEVDTKLLQQALNCTKEHLTREFVDNFDVIYVMHIPNWIINNWNVIKDKIVIWRTIGQSTSDVEAAMAPYRKQGMRIVRYSPKESTITGYIGGDTIIRFYKDENEFCCWNGANRRVITVAQAMPERGAFCHFDIFTAATQGFPRILYGPRNEMAGDVNGGVLNYEQLKAAYRDNRLYFYTGTHPASYTMNFIEAFMTGIPMVCIGPGYGNMPGRPDCANLYEIPEIITNGVNGFYSDSIDELRHYIQLLLDDESLAKRISENARKRAIELFGKEKIKEQWRVYWQSLGVI